MASTPANATIYQVAQHAGVSISTVSLAINHPHRVSAETRRKVTRAAELSGYRPRRRGGGGNSRSALVTVAAPFSAWPSYYERLNGVLKTFGAAGVGILLHDLPATNAVQAPILAALPVRGDVDGLIVMGTPLSAQVEESLRSAGTATVLVDAESVHLPRVVCDDKLGGRLLGRHLCALGHRRILFAHEEQVSFDYVSAGIDRFDGLCQAAQECAAQVEHDQVDEQALRTALAAGTTAVVASNDDVALTVLGMLRRLGVAVPGQVSVSGYDGRPFAQALDLTTVSQPLAESGRAAADLMLRMLEGTAWPVRTLTLAPSLVVRGSTAAPPTPPAQLD